LQAAIARGLAYAPFADMLWVETSTPDLEEAREFAAAIRAKFPGKLLAYNCSPSFNWKRHLNDATIAAFQKARCFCCWVHSAHASCRLRALHCQTLSVSRRP
jgi:isocitrate lyase